MKNKFFYSLMFLLVSLSTVGQKKVDWKDLSKVKFKEKYFKVYDEWMLYPNFSESVKALNGREISISGYFLDVDPTGKMYVLSKNPMSSCFFLWRWRTRDSNGVTICNKTKNKNRCNYNSYRNS